MTLVRTLKSRWQLLVAIGVLGLAWFFLPQPNASSAPHAWLVESTADSGPGTLRAALNSATPFDTITFDPAVFPRNHPATIYVLSALPSISQHGLTLDASNAGAIIDGTSAPGGARGLVVDADNCTVQGLTIQHFPDNGIQIEPGASGNLIGGDRTHGTGPNGEGNLIIHNHGDGIEIRGPGADNNRIQGNYIGIDATGRWDAGNQWSGVAIWNGAAGNIVGSALPGGRNVISGNDHNGVWMGGSETRNNRVIGNYIGTRADGLAAVPNTLSGVSLPDGTHDNEVGGAHSGEGNLISGNGDFGIYISDPGTSGNRVRGNIIGLNRDGAGIIGQGLDGVIIAAGASGNRIGGGAEADRNLISGNSRDGVHIVGGDTSLNQVQGNYIGTDISGALAMPNGLHGVELSQGAHHNLVGGSRSSGLGNVLSGNSNHGLVLTFGARNNTIAGNLIGPDASGSLSLGNQPFGGVDVADGARHNVIGGETWDERNVISGNNLDGIALFTTDTYTGSATADNAILGNLIGLTLNGDGPLPNKGYGIFNVQGAVRTRIEGNTIGGNLSDGILLAGEHCVDGVVSDNLIGTDRAGAQPVGNGGVGLSIVDGAHGHTVDGNTVSGNRQGGIVIRDRTPGLSPYGNVVRNNRVGTTPDRASTLPNGGPGIQVLETAHDNSIGPGNVIAHNNSYGVILQSCDNNPITETELWSNASGAIQSSCAPAPQITNLALGPPDRVTGTASPFARIEFFTDDDAQGQTYEGYALADSSGAFAFSKPAGFAGPNLTASATDTSGATSALSRPNHLSWTFLLYLNGDNDLEEFMLDTVSNTVAAGPSPRANVLALVDVYSATLPYSGTVLYDLSWGEAQPLSDLTGERNMGAAETLEEFVTWGREYYPSRHSLLVILDHGGGWAPSAGDLATGALLHKREYLEGGGSGMSWDYTDGFDYIDSQEIRQAMAAITDDGADPVDVVFFDVCLMGMLEVAYQIKDYATYFVSSQNIGWAPLGPQSRYVRTVQNLAPTAMPRQMASLLVQTYADGLPSQQHPFTVSAVDLNALPAVADSVATLGTALGQTLASPGGAESLRQAYLQAQKIDYDSDFRIEPDTDGFVDLQDFALRVTQTSNDPDVVAAATDVSELLDIAIVAEQHRTDAPWLSPEETWNLDNVHGLSIFLPVGEDLELGVAITETSPVSPTLVITRNLRLRDLYSPDRLQFVADTGWDRLIDRYYEVTSSPVMTDTKSQPLPGVQEPDIQAPTTTITLTGAPVLGNPLTVAWRAIDDQSGVAEATLWQRATAGPWTQVATQPGSLGTFSVTPDHGCRNTYSVRTTDNAGNVEGLAEGSNVVSVIVLPCASHFPLTFADTPSAIAPAGAEMTRRIADAGRWWP